MQFSKDELETILNALKYTYEGIDGDMGAMGDKEANAELGKLDWLIKNIEAGDESIPDFSGLFEQNPATFITWLMEEFRSGDESWQHHLSEDDRLELFVSMPTGASDLTYKLFQEVCDNYGESLTDVLNR